MINSKYIYDILDLILDGDDDGLNARKQLPYITESDIEYTGVGAFISFDHDELIEKFKIDNDNLILGNLIIESKKDNVEATATLFFNNGKIYFLEILCHTDEYPKKDLTSYQLKQNWGNERIIERY